MKSALFSLSACLVMGVFTACSEQGEWDPGEEQHMEDALNQLDMTELAKAPAFPLIQILLGDPNPGNMVGVSTWGQVAGAPVGLLYGFSGEGAGPCPSVFNGTCTDLLNPIFGGIVAADADGFTYREVFVPPFSNGTPMTVQAFGVRAMAMGNPVPLSRPTTEFLSDPGCICTFIYSPVCGADGVTYSNDCLAECDGAAVVSNGFC